MVESFEVMTLSSNQLHVSWKPPLFPNGVITLYIIKVANLVTSMESLYVIESNVHQHNISSGIGKHQLMPYTKCMHKGIQRRVVLS